MLSEGSENGEWSGWWSSHIWNGKIKAMFQTTNQYIYIYIHIDLL
jgi:predicted small integral membrane protein